MFEITPSIHINENELGFTFIRADGPGGQNVNKVATAVQLRFDVTNSPSLPDEVKPQLIKLAGKRMTQEGILIIEAKRYRTQEANRADALSRFFTLVKKAIEKPKIRRKTKPSATSREKRLESKRIRGQLKRQRRENFNIE